MPLTAEKLYEDALSLSSEARAHLAERLVFSLAEGIPPAIEKEHLAEVRRRMAEVDSGAVKLIPGGQVLAKGRAELKRLAKK